MQSPPKTSAPANPLAIPATPAAIAEALILQTLSTDEF
jgi:hypothetical protein